MNPKKILVPKWFDIVSRLSQGEIKKFYAPTITRHFDGVYPDKKLKLSNFRQLRGDNIVLSKYCGVPPSKRAKLVRVCKSARARGEVSSVGNFSIVHCDDKMQFITWKLKYKSMFDQSAEN